MADDGTTAVQRRRRLPGRAMWFLLVLMYVVVIASWAWSYDLGDTSRNYDRLALTTFLVRVLGVQIGLGGVVVMAIAVLARRWRFAAACVPLVVFLLWPVHAGFVGANGSTTTRDADLVVMSVNLRRGAGGSDALLRRIEDADPDVIVFQEYTDDWDRQIRDGLADSYPYSTSVPRPDPQGIATFSRQPFDEEHGGATTLRLGRWDVPAIRTAFTMRGHEFVVYNVHLAMPLSVNAHAEQRRQVKRLVGIVEGEQSPMIVVGDLNHTETTQHASALLDAGLRSAWDVQHDGRGETWRRPSIDWMPGLRLDHVLVSGNITVEGMRRGVRGESDHWPLVVGLGFRS